MENISASKIVFMAIGLTACSAYLISILNGAIVPDEKNFISLALLAFGFYYGTKIDGTPTGGVK